jgi:SnoaL-like domain
MIDHATPGLFLAALSLRDFERFADCLAPAVQARMLLPRGPELRSGREEIALRFEGWFGRAAEFTVVESSCERVGSRTRLTWRFRMSRERQPLEVIEQVAFVDVGADGITHIDLLCSGFLPDEAPIAPGAGDVCGVS